MFGNLTKNLARKHGYPRPVKETRMKNLFPKFTGRYGGYIVRVLFPDEGRGERFFDSWWVAFQVDTPGRFRLSLAVDHRGEWIHSSPANTTIGPAIRVGDQFIVHVNRLTPRGQRHIHSRFIEVKAVTLADNHVEIEYVYPK